MTIHPLAEKVMVSRKSFESDEAYDIVYSNITAVNALFEDYFTADEIAPRALQSYYVDYYLAQVNNGGFSQFVYNTNWNAEIVGQVGDGLRAINAAQHSALFDEGADLIAQAGDDVLNEYLESEYFGDNAARDFLNTVNDNFYKISETEDLIEFNSKWLRGLPDLMILPVEEMEAQIAAYAATIPDRENRIAAARANEPDYFKKIRRLCDVAGYEFERVTAGDHTHRHEGNKVFAWHFITDKGHFYLLEIDGKAQMRHGKFNTLIAEINADAD